MPSVWAVAGWVGCTPTLSFLHLIKNLKPHRHSGFVPDPSVSTSGDFEKNLLGIFFENGVDRPQILKLGDFPMEN